MDACLMHGEVPVAELTFHVQGGISSVSTINNQDHMPVITRDCKNEKLLRHIRIWWSKRAIPKSRREFNSVL